MALPRPYYQDDLACIYLADCKDILPDLPQFDLLLTDPPYGIASIWKGGAGHGWGKARAEGEARNQWDDKPPSKELLELCIAKAKTSIIWGGNYLELPPQRGWLVWNKPERGFSLAEAELAWSNRENVIRVFDGNRSEAYREHPTQKTEALMRWCISHGDEPKTVLDAFAGSCTTLRAAKDLGIKSVGIEAVEAYAEMGAKRLRQEVLNFSEGAK